MSSMKKIAELIKDVKFAMLTTITDEGHLHACPMTTQDVEFNGEIWFIGSNTTETVSDMQKRPQVNLAYSKPSDSAYVSINGTAELVTDPAKLDELWSDMYNAYFEGGKTDPRVQLIKINAHGAEYWDGPNKLVALYEMTKATLTGETADMGDNGTVRIA